jgi:hypothetical protein
VSGAISWAFQHVDELIIMEDDCVVDPSFFEMCRTLLERHRSDERVCSIGAANYQDGQRRGDGDYYVSKYPHYWGWATWKRAWSHYQDDIEALRPFVESRDFESRHDSEQEVLYWRDVFAMCVEGKVNSWGYRWTFSCWKRGAVALLPNVNLVENIGFDSEATHTTESDVLPQPRIESLKTFNAPSSLRVDKEADRYTFDHVYIPTHDAFRIAKLRRQVRELKGEVKQCRAATVSDAKKLERQRAWVQKHPFRAACRALRGKMPKV